MTNDAHPVDHDSGRGISVLHHGASTLVVLTGDLDIFDAINFGPISELAVAVDQPEALVEADGVTFIDCAFLGALVTLEHRCRRNNGRFRIVSASGPLRRLCQLVGLDRLLDHAVPTAPHRGARQP